MSASKKHLQQTRLASTIEYLKKATAGLPVADQTLQPSYEDKNNWVLLRLAPITEPRRAYMLEAHKNRQGKDDSSLIKQFGHSVKEGFHAMFVEGSNRHALRKELGRPENSDLRQFVLSMNEIFVDSADSGPFVPHDDVERALTLIELAHTQIMPLTEQDPAISKEVLQQYIDDVSKSYPVPLS